MFVLMLISGSFWFIKRRFGEEINWLRERGAERRNSGTEGTKINAGIWKENGEYIIYNESKKARTKEDEST